MHAEATTNPFDHAAPDPGQGALAGLVVVDLSRVLAGPYATMMAGDMGATVIKVEHPDGDETRGFRPPTRGDDSTYYLSANRNKVGIMLDFARADDLDTLLRIIDRADVLVENFRDGSLAKYGLDYASVAARRPDIVYASITGFGSGAGAHLPGYDLCVQALSGLMSIQGDPDGDGSRSGFALFDVFAGMYTTVGILAALQDRARTGLGQRIEVNLMNVAMAAMVNQTMAFAAGDVVPRAMGNEHPSLYPYAPFPAADRPLVVAVGNDAQFRRLCTEIGREALADDARFATNTQRTRHRSELRPHLVAALAAHDADHWFDRLNAVGVPCAPINDVAQGVAFANSIGLDPITGIRPDGDPTVRSPIGFTRTPVTYRLRPPRLGEHDDEIRRWLDTSPPRKAPV